MIQLGDVVRDKITKFTGTVTVKAEYLSGEIRFGIEAFVCDPSKASDTVYFDIDRLEIAEPPKVSGR